METVHLGWSADERPRWQVRAVFQLVEAVPGRPGRYEAMRLRSELLATGKVRWVSASIRRGVLELALDVKAEDDQTAMFAGLCILDSAVRHVQDVVLGDLLRRSARPR